MENILYVVENNLYMLWITDVFPTTYTFDVVHNISPTGYNFDVVHNISPTTYPKGVLHNIYPLFPTIYHMFSTIYNTRAEMLSTI